MARDFYSETEALAVNVNQIGFDDLAARLTNAIEAGFTSSEILMRIRTVLIEALPAVEDKPDLHDAAVSLIEGINELPTIVPVHAASSPPSGLHRRAGSRASTPGAQEQVAKARTEDLNARNATLEVMNAALEAENTALREQIATLKRRAIRDLHNGGQPPAQDLPT